MDEGRDALELFNRTGDTIDTGRDALELFRRTGRNGINGQSKFQLDNSSYKSNKRDKEGV